MAVTLTGSDPAGRKVASTAGEVLKKTVLELGGSDPSVVLADADLDAAATHCATVYLTKTAQSCVAAKRFIVVDEVREAFEEKVGAAMAAWVVGDPTDPETGVGPSGRAWHETDLAGPGSRPPFPA